MKGALSANPRVLLCTAYRRFRNDYWDVIGGQVFGLPRVASPRRVSMSLRFLKQNVPEVEILEYPMWPEYVERLREGWDVVGFTFFENEIAEIARMAEEARSHGIRELWAGGYGALNPAIPRIVDRVFTGASEDAVARVFGYRIPDDSIEHPVMCWPGTIKPGNIPLLTLGLLYTQHGCPFECSFCQTPALDTRPLPINIESIERVIKHYRSKGLTDLFIADELFGYNPRLSEKLTGMFARYKFRWWAQSRISLILDHLDEWYEKGLRFPMIGLESTVQKSLDIIKKRQKTAEIEEYAERTKEKPGIYRIVDWMIGYENMSREETIQDAVQLKRMGFDAHGVSVLTPFPGTPLWKELDSKYGIIKDNYRDFDTGHLVWNHPEITPSQMLYLRASLINYLNNPFDAYIRPFSRIVRERLREKGFEFVWRDLIKGPLAASLYDDRKQIFFKRLGS